MFLGLFATRPLDRLKCGGVKRRRGSARTLIERSAGDRTQMYPHRRVPGLPAVTTPFCGLPVQVRDPRPERGRLTFRAAGIEAEIDAIRQGGPAFRIAAPLKARGRDRLI